MGLGQRTQYFSEPGKLLFRNLSLEPALLSVIEPPEETGAGTRRVLHGIVGRDLEKRRVRFLQADVRQAIEDFAEAWIIAFDQHWSV